MKNFSLLLLLSSFFFILSCNPAPPSEAVKDEAVLGNPPAEGFNAAASDDKAIALADQVMEKMGGRKNWDNTRYLHWNFFGRRTLLWIKKRAMYVLNSRKNSPRSTW